MALDTRTIEPGEVTTAPLTYTLKDSEAFSPQSISVRFDGTAASGSFLACVTFLAQDGKVIARCPTDVALSVGDVAEVTYAPFLRTGGGGGAASGIQYDVDNVGTWLQVETTGANPGDPGVGIELHGGGANGGVDILTDNQPVRITGGGDLTHGGVQILSNGNGLSLIIDSASSSPLFIDTAQGQLISIGADHADSGNVLICNDPLTVGNGLGFFATTPTVQQTLPAVPTTAQIRALLVAYGLCAP